ncbi:MAG TPA: hypothetical protein VJ873_11370, partial [bacterium]|nr:hypothetical protein [bacterium]
MKRFFFTVLVFSVIAGFDGASADPLPSAGAALPAPPAVLNPTPVPTNAPTSAPTLTPSPELKLSGKWGIGSGFINYRSNVYTCLSVRSWVSDGACLDFLGYYSGYSNDGTDFVGNAAQQPTYYLGGGLGLKCNLAEVRKNLFLQLQTEVTYIHYHYQYSSAYESYTSDSETW